MSMPGIQPPYSDISFQSQEEAKEARRLFELEEIDRQRFIEDVTSLMRVFMGHGISQDVSAQLAGIFYNDPEIKKRRASRRKKK